MSLPIVRTDLPRLTEEEIRPIYEFQRRMDRERSPDDPKLPFEQMVASIRNIPAFVEVFAFLVREGDGTVVASADFAFLKTPENQHMGQFGISVLPPYRRRGIGRRLLNEIVTTAERHERRLMITNATDRIPAGARFLERIGARIGLETHVNQLKFEDLNRGLLRRWLEEHVSEGFTLGFWSGPYPEENLEEMVALNELFNHVPRGDLDMEDFRFTAEQIRQQEASMTARGVERWTCFVRDNANGKIAGITEMLWNPHRPTHIHQGITAVWPEYRGKGLGRWLKAEMLEKVLRERPAVTLVRTENADVNAPMLKINTELGFRPYRAEYVWQIETARARAYLNGTEGGEAAS
ncbi:MAG: GNAT family N-acetyltransferase [Capsulimonadales bacterium]|nr:GNAT family N-acetyltransferase [Capsulimonadales bacterium]